MATLPICQQCFDDLPWDTRLQNSRCHNHHHHDNQHEHETLSAFYYAPPIKQTLRRAKFGKQLAQIQWLADITAFGLKPKINANKTPQAIIPVPLHNQRLRQRGFNQSLELARPLAKQLNLPLINDLVIRSRHTQAQSSLAANERSTNIADAFRLNPSRSAQKQLVTLQHIALFDDVITTGATLNEIKQLLHKAGVQRIDLWSCARTMQ